MLHLNGCRARRYVACSATVALSAGLLVNGCAQRPSNYTAAVVEEAKQRADQTVPRPAVAPNRSGTLAQNGGPVSSMPPLQQRPAVPPRQAVAGVPRVPPSAEGSVRLNDQNRIPRGGHLLTPRTPAATIHSERRPTQPVTSDPFLVAELSRQPAIPPGTKPPEAMGQVHLPAKSPQPGLERPAIAQPRVTPPGVGPQGAVPQGAVRTQDASAVASTPPHFRRSQTALAAPPMPTAAERMPIASPEPQASRLAQLRDQLRAAAFADARPESQIPTDNHEQPRQNDRGVLLSDGRAAPMTPANRASAATLAERTASPATERATATTPTAERLAGLAVRPSPGSTSADAPAGRVRLSGAAAPNAEAGSAEQDAAERQAKTALQVQSLLAAADWHVEQGDLQRAYQNAAFALRLADREKLAFEKGDRHPSDVARKIWRAMHEPAGSPAVTDDATIALSGRPAAAPRNAFPSTVAGGWQSIAASAPVSPRQSELPTVTPWKPTAPVPPTRGATLTSRIITTPIQTAPHEPDATASVSLASIESQSSDGNARPRDIVVNAVAEVESQIPLNGPIRGPLHGPSLGAVPDEPSMTVPAMAAFPKWDDRGPALAQPKQVPPPPSLEVIGSQRAAEMQPTATDSTIPAGTLWGLVGLIAGVIGSAFLFRKSSAASKA